MLEHLAHPGAHQVALAGGRVAVAAALAGTFGRRELVVGRGIVVHGRMVRRRRAGVKTDGRPQGIGAMSVRLLRMRGEPAGRFALNTLTNTLPDTTFVPVDP